jgi:hypothetical protein
MRRARACARHRHGAAPEAVDVGGGVVRRREETRGDDGGLVAGEAGDTRDTWGLQGFGQSQRRQDGAQPARQHPGEEPALSG